MPSASSACCQLPSAGSAELCEAMHNKIASENHARFMLHVSAVRGRQRRAGQSVMKPFWEITPAEALECLRATTWPPAIYEYFRGGGAIAFVGDLVENGSVRFGVEVERIVVEDGVFSQPERLMNLKIEANRRHACMVTA